MTTVLVVGDTPRAHAWEAALQRAKAVCSVQRVDADWQTVREQISHVPQAKLAIAAGSGLTEAVAALAAQHDVGGLISAPPGTRLPKGFQRAPDFEAAPGVRWLSKHLSGATTLQVEIHGSADGHGDDVCEAALIGLLVVVALVGEAELTVATLMHESLFHAELSSRQLPHISLVARSGGHSLRVQAKSERTQLELSVNETSERRVLRGAGDTVTRDVVLPPAPARALSALFTPVAALGAPALFEKARAELMRLAPSPAAFLSLREATRAPASDSDWPWAVAGALQPESGVDTLTDPPGTSVLELAAFEAGLKPAVLLPQSREQAEGTAARFAHCRVLDLASGTLFVAAHRARDLETLVQLRSAADPDPHLREIGALLGYPKCCVDAFARLSDRSDDARTRYATARGTAAEANWAWPLNDTGVRVLPFFACSYTCPHARKQAEAVLELLRVESPAVHAALAERLAAPVLYFDENAFIRVKPVGATHRQVGVPRGAPEWLRRIARALARRGTLRTTGDQLEVTAEGAVSASVKRTLPYGLWLPFATE